MKKQKQFRKFSFVFLVILQSERNPGEPKALQKAKAAYVACVNVKYANQLRLPQKRVLEEEGGWPLISGHSCSKDFSWNQIGDVIATYGVPLFFDLQVGPNLYNASENVIWVRQSFVSVLSRLSFVLLYTFVYTTFFFTVFQR